MHLLGNFVLIALMRLVKMDYSMTNKLRMTNKKIYIIYLGEHLD